MPLRNFRVKLPVSIHAKGSRKSKLKNIRPNWTLRPSQTTNKAILTTGRVKSPNQLLLGTLTFFLKALTP